VRIAPLPLTQPTPCSDVTSPSLESQRSLRTTSSCRACIPMLRDRNVWPSSVYAATRWRHSTPIAPRASPHKKPTPPPISKLCAALALARGAEYTVSRRSHTAHLSQRTQAPPPHTQYSASYFGTLCAGTGAGLWGVDACSNSLTFLLAPFLYRALSLSRQIASHGPYNSVQDLYKIPTANANDKKLFKQYASKFTVLPPGRMFNERINARQST